MAKNPKFEVFKGTSAVKDQFYWHLKAPNGEIVCQSEGYASNQAALDTIHAVKKWASSAWVVELDKE
jgi:uncharacterized protein YegP (UPF0339 family)